MDNRVQISLLLDLYGKLLTDKQQNTMDLYFNEDLSLAEISEINNISRQATFDIINKCQKSLLQYDSKLKLMEKENLTLETKISIKDKLGELKKIISSQSELNIIDNIMNDIEKL
ncbi:putative DNA-binding protein [Clostridium akagii]|uniref:putative DNA-binding protein n=1 Tax=Clostridium akagii TaxID=91623 RepID=UPI00047D306F|nr:putative DNA-binding protein [Clostridium akagii]